MYVKEIFECDDIPKSGVSVLVSCTAILTSAAALFWLTAYSTNWEVEAAVVGAGAVAVSAASAWAVGVTVSLESG